MATEYILTQTVQSTPGSGTKMISTDKVLKHGLMARVMKADMPMVKKKDMGYLSGLMGQVIKDRL